MKKRWGKWLLWSLLLILAAGGWFGYSFWKAQGGMAPKPDAVDRLFEVKRGELVIGLSLGGSVASREQHRLSMEANTSSKLIWIIEENSAVKTGEVLAKFDTEELIKQIDLLNVQFDNLETDLAKAEESEKIQDRSDAADKQAAADKLVQAREAMRKYRSFEYRKSRDSMVLAVQTAEDKVREAQQAYLEQRDATDSDNDSQASDEEKRKRREQALQKALVAISSAENDLKAARNALKVFKRYDHPNTLRQKKSDVEQAELQLKRAEVSYSSNRNQAVRQIQNIKTNMENNRADLKRLEGDKSKMELITPVDGVVLYGDSNQRRWGNPLEVKLGMELWRGQVLMTIPDMSNLVVEFDLPELYRSRVKVGDIAVITPDSLPGLKLGSKIETIATLPINVQPWNTNSPKVYKSRLVLDRQDAALVNGMSVKIELVTKVIPDTLTVPVEAIFEEKDRMYVFRQTVTGPVEVDVKIGDSNDNSVEILEGLAAGDRVCLYRPYQSHEKK